MNFLTLFLILVVTFVFSQETGCDKEAEMYCQDDYVQCNAKVMTLGLTSADKCECFSTWLSCINMGCEAVETVQNHCKNSGCADATCLTGSHSHKVVNEYGTAGMAGSDASIMSFSLIGAAALALLQLF